MESIMYILARIFGKKYIGCDYTPIGGHVVIIIYFWRKKYWVWKIE